MSSGSLAARRGAAWPARRLRRLSLTDIPTVAGVAATAVGMIALVGWAFDLGILKSMVAGLPTMKVNTAVCFTLMGAGVVLLSQTSNGSRARSVGFVFVGLAGSIALATGVEHVTGVSLRIDQLLFRDSGVQLGSAAAGRMSPLTAMCFIGLSVAAFVGTRMPRIVIALSGGALALAVLNVFTFVFDAPVPPVLAGYSQMALNTAVAMGVLALGVVGLLGTASPFAPLAGRSPATRLLRGALVLAVMVPLAMIAVTLVGQQLGLYGTTYGIAIRLLGMISLGVVAILGSASWVKDLEAKRESLEIERERFFELSLDMLSVVDADGRFVRVNRAWETSLGYRVDQLVGQSAIELIHPDDLDRTMAEAVRRREPGERVDAFQSRLRHADGSYRWLEWVSQTAPEGLVSFAVARDVTDRKRREDRRAKQHRVLESRNEVLSERSIRDPLTGLHNRRYFDRVVTRLERRWTRLAVDRRPPVAVIIFDLDHFGAVNKLYGHQAGDAVLRLFAGLLRKRFREHDLVARYGGEEFVAILEGATSAEALLIAEDIRSGLERASIDVGIGAPISVTVSAGCTELGDERDVSAGMSVADVWLAQAKRGGRNQVVGL
jgi:diguanylate cyclase (GGDEF)-like protein/PAS domain S-box-containing protein